MIKKLILLVSAAVWMNLMGVSLQAQVTLSDFSKTSLDGLAFKSFTGSWNDGVTDQVIENSTFMTVTSVSGGAPFGDGSVTLAAGSSPTSFFDLSSFNTGASFSLTARSDINNKNDTFKVQLFKYSGVPIEVASAVFNSSSFSTSAFTTVSSSLIYKNAGLMNQIDYFTIVGNGDSTASSFVTFSFDNLSIGTAAVPEPSTYALMGMGIVGLLIAYRRRALVPIKATIEG